MGKEKNPSNDKVTLSLTDEERKVLFAIATNMYKKEPNSRRWKEVATRFGFPNQRALKGFLMKELSLPIKSDSNVQGGNDHQP